MRALVVSSVHPADDPRVRERTARTLATAGLDVRYAVKEPPADRSGIEFVKLGGGRLRRWWGALRQMLRADVDVISLHDPELIPAGVLARLFRRTRVVIDVHENVPAQIRHKQWLPRLLRPPAAWASRLILRLAEATCDVTLAEFGYRRLFRRDHPVFPNYPVAGTLPPVAPGEGFVVYVGDITEARGAQVMVEAMRGMARKLVLIGRCSPELRSELAAMAGAFEIDVELTGPLPWSDAMALVGRAEVGLSPLLDVPNYRHSMPTKLIEYLSLGLPVAASNLPATRQEVIGLRGVELVPPGDAQALARAIERATALRGTLTEQAAELRRSRSWPSDRVAAFYLER